MASKNELILKETISATEGSPVRPNLDSIEGTLDTTEFLKNLFVDIDDTINTKKQSGTNLITTENKDEKAVYYLPDNQIFGVWKLMLNLSARVISYDDESVLLECLVDKEQRIYEKIQYASWLFKGFELFQGKLFKICQYARQNEARLVVKDNPNLILDDDFPKTNFASKFADVKIKAKG